MATASQGSAGISRVARRAGTAVRHPRKVLARLRGQAAAPAPAPVVDEGPVPPGSCIVCRSDRTRSRTVTVKGREYPLLICQRCGFVHNATNTVDYTKFKSVEKFELTPRVGTADRPGREFHMARLGVEVLRREGLHVNVFGAGRSLDYQRIRTLPGVERAIVSDVVDLGLDDDFLNIHDGTDQRFDLVIACEVVEHFLDPVTEFGRLLDLLTPEGLLICSTNIRDGGNVAKQSYLYRRGHVSYYAPRTIARIARRHGALFDFRVPEMAVTEGGPRKRYVIFSRSRDVMERVTLWFGGSMYAPSEPADAYPARRPPQDPAPAGP